MNFENTYSTLHYTNQYFHIFVYIIIISKYCSYIYIVYSNVSISFYWVYNFAFAVFR